ncbi:c-type cytochrome [Roseovarius pacificus]|uniref:c-type cytochrome n=1 Tax=Roseovarius pacificus TaxID=337701 RepID=UPI0029699C59|nr:c-type cytochrome [Roseovarius pacificus]MDW3117084.1 c-type cytochrome [Roseovarius pacificus]
MSKSLKLYGLSGVGAVALLTAAYNFADRNVASMPDEMPIVSADAGSPDMMFIAAARADEAAEAKRLGLGREALPEEVAAWDLDVSPDGTGLPEGSGSVMDGETLFIDNCAICHGDFAEGVGNWPKLAGGDDTLADKDPVKTVGSYWPYLSTAWDYVHRSMPFGAAQTMSADDTYAIVAYILYSNYLVDEDFVLTNENFLEVEMPNADGFIVDDRAETEYPRFSEEACMENCKDSVEITMRAAVLDVTPEEEGEAEAEDAMEEANADTAADEKIEQMAEAEPEEAAAEEVATEEAALDMALVEDGEKVFRKCKACHQVGDGAKNRVGPQLNDVIGRHMAAVGDFKYSKTLQSMGEEGLVWNAETMAEFLSDPRGYVKGTKMSFNGLRKDEDIAAVTEYLKSFSQ